MVLVLVLDFVPFVFEDSLVSVFVEVGALLEQEALLDLSSDLKELLELV